MDGYYQYWGKASKEEDAFHLLPYHSLDVAAVAQTLLAQNPAQLTALSKLADMENDIFKQWAVFFIALHDLGKFSKSFQNLKPELFFELQQRRTESPYAIRHDSLGYMVWKSHIYQSLVEAACFNPPKPREILKPVDFWAMAVTGHHGQPPKNEAGVQNYFDSADIAAAIEFAKAAASLLLEEGSLLTPGVGQSKRLSWWLAGFSVLCDWLGSNREFFNYQASHIPLEDYWSVALANAEAATASTELIPAIAAALHPPSDLFGWTSEQPTPLQQECINTEISHQPSLYIIEDVTGAGKTEAAIILAHRLMASKQAHGIYFALPTMATANAMYDRLANVYRRLFTEDTNPSLVLAHGGRELSKSFRQSIVQPSSYTESNNGDGSTTATAHCAEWLTDNRKKALLADIGVGTIDQALLAILPSRHQSLRLLGLLGKILIVDEVHACDAYMNPLLCALLRAHSASGGHAILLSASLPKAQRVELVQAFADGAKLDFDEKMLAQDSPYPLVTAFNAANHLSETSLETRQSVKRRVRTEFCHDLEDAYSRIIEAHNQGQCVCWIRNTVDDAREAFEVLRRTLPNVEIDLFHARFAMNDRLDIEQKCIARFGPESKSKDRSGKILIATQVVEQSLDIDFDLMITDLAPVDRIIQRAGRLCRHARNKAGDPVLGPDERGEPTLVIVSPTIDDEPNANWFTAMFPRAGKVYANHAHLWLTTKLLAEMGEFQMPEDARMLIEDVYDNPDYPTNLEENVLRVMGEEGAARSLANSNSLKLNAGYGDSAVNKWWDDAITPTRLGEDTTLVYFAKWNGSRLVPWAEGQDHPWQRSAVQIRTAMVAQTGHYEGIGDASLEQCRQQMPSKCKWGVLIPLVFDDSSGVWIGHGESSNQKPVVVHYNALTGVALT